MRQVQAAPINKLDPVSFDKLLQRQNPFAGARCEFDLRGIQLITPAALVQLTAACHALSRDHSQPVLLVDNKGVRSYLQRCSFFEVVKEVAHIEPAIEAQDAFWSHRRYGSNPMLIEVTKLETGAALPDLLDRTVWTLRYRLKYKKYDAFDVTTAVSEICQNTFDHNTGTAGFVAMQVYETGVKRFLEIGIADYGDGLVATLSRNPKNPDVGSDLAAIRLATKLGISQHDDPTRGTGLFHLLELVYKHKGSVQIRSGEAKVRFRMDKQTGWAFSVPRMPGVQVAMTFPAKTSS